jgi:hypothetical protein
VAPQNCSLLIAPLAGVVFLKGRGLDDFAVLN